jgi:hypothetical protein
MKTKVYKKCKMQEFLSLGYFFQGRFIIRLILLEDISKIIFYKNIWTSALIYGQ